MTADRTCEAVWSPDGERIAYHSQAKRRHLGRAGVRRCRRSRWSPLGSEPAWSPDGSQLAFSTYQGALAERAVIMTVPVARRRCAAADAPRRAPRRARGPAWSHDGRRVAFYSVRRHSEGSSLWIVRRDRRRTDARRRPASCRTKSLSRPDDRMRLLERHRARRSNVGIWCVALDQATPAAPLRCSRAWPGVWASRSPGTARSRMLFEAPRAICGRSRCRPQGNLRDDR